MTDQIPPVTRFVTGKDDAEPIVVEWYVVLPSPPPPGLIDAIIIAIVAIGVMPSHHPTTICTRFTCGIHQTTTPNSWLMQSI
jgi:hypothetical protein